MFQLSRIRVCIIGFFLCSCEAKKETVYHLELPTGHGLFEQASVRMRGAEVGHLERVVGDKAVFVPMKEDIRFDTSATWRVSVAGLLGDRFLEVVPGPADSKKHEFGETIKVSPLDSGINLLQGLKITKPVEEIGRILDALAGVPEEKREQATKAAIEAIQKVKTGDQGEEGK